MTNVATWERPLLVGYAFQNWTEIGGDNCGQAVEKFQALVGIRKGDPWCAAFASYCGYYGFYDRTAKRTTWPVKLSGGCAVLGEWAQSHGCLVRDPQPGDLFLIWHAELGRFAHTGFIVSVNADGSCTTLEGNTSGGGSRNGWGVFERTRHFAARDRFIHWQALIT